MGILQSIIGLLGTKGEDEEGSGEPCPALDRYKNPCIGGSFRASLCNMFKNLLQKISCIFFFGKPDPILPVRNSLVSSRNHTFLQEISSPGSDSSDSSPRATYVSPSVFNPKAESHVDAAACAPPSDLELQRDYPDRGIESHVYVPAYVPPADLELQRDYSDEEIESHVNLSAYVPPSDSELQRDYSNSSEHQVYSCMAEKLAASSATAEPILDENYTKQLDVVIDVPALAHALAHRNALDLVDSAFFIETEKIEQCPDDQNVIKSEQEVDQDEKVIDSLATEGKWIKHYNSYHKILLVGEGDFSFSASLAVAFGFASNIIATSLDSAEFLKKNYKRAMSNIEKLRIRGGIVLHGIDATKIANHSWLGTMTFDRIIFNFPFAGFFKNLSREAQLRKHRRLVGSFLENAREMLCENGEIHITHKTNDFHSEWKLESVASCHRLGLIEAVEFDVSDYPGYNTKCGFGGNNNFNCHPSKTYKFGLKPKRGRR